jgi:hypothetical protein
MVRMKLSTTVLRGPLPSYGYSSCSISPFMRQSYFLQNELSNQITPWFRVFLEQLIFIQLVKIFPTLMEPLSLYAEPAQI